MNRLELIANNVFASNFNHTLHAYIDIAGGLVEGTLLGQIMYWFSPDKNGTIRAQIKKDGEYWIAKKRSDWWDEIRITDRQYDRAIKSLLDKNIIVIAKYKFCGLPTPHIRPNYEKIGELLDEYLCNINSKIDTKKSAQISAQNTTDVKTGITQSVKRELHKTQNGNYTKRNSHITENTNIEYTENNNICATETCATKTTQAKTETDKAKQKKTNHSKQNEQTQTIDEMFSKFWEAYPKRKDKKRAYKVFSKIKPDDKLLQQMLDCIEREKKSLDWLKDNGQYIPYPSSWLNGERWNDEDITDTVTIIGNKPKAVPVVKNVALESLRSAAEKSTNTPALGDIGDMWGDDDDY